MSDLWIPRTAIEAEWTMRIEAAKFEKMRVEAEADKIMSKIDRTRMLKDRVEQNLAFLNSRRAKIVLILEYRNAKRNLAALAAEEAALLRLLEMQEQDHDRLQSEINSLEKEAAKVGKVLRFKKREQREGEGSQD